MCKTLLIPTDFTIRSLGLLKTALNDHLDQQVIIVIGHGVKLSTSIADLLFFSRSQLMQSLISKEFEEALQVIESKYESQIKSIRIETFSGYNQSAFHQYVLGNQIDESYVYTNYTPKYNYQNSFDISPLISKLDIVHQVAFEGKNAQAERQESFADLFFSRIPGLNPKS